MKTQVDIVTGFLGAGKTRFINRALRAEAADSKHTVLLQLEFGQTELQVNETVQIVRNTEAFRPDPAYLRRLLVKYSPDRFIIESNGMLPTADLLEALESAELRKICKIRRVFFIADCRSFPLQYRNYSALLNELISQCDVAVKTNSSGSGKDDLSSIDAVLSSVNPYLKIYDIRSERAFCGLLEREFSIAAETGGFFSGKALFFLLLVLVYLAFEIFRALLPSGIRVPGLQTLNAVFLSILFEAFPFVLIGVFVSSVIQVLLPARLIERIFLKRKALGFFAAMFAGIVFPVCDCATVPVAARLIKKGVPVPIAITFLLSAPLVNPIVILSTLYAFPGYPFIAVCRAATGLLIALLAGAAFSLLPENKRKVTAAMEVGACDCGLRTGAGLRKSGFWGKAEAVLGHASGEFFNVGIYLIIGAMISSILQVYLPKSVMTGLGGNRILSVLSMMFAAFILSICSTSDAFIARTFANVIPIGSVMGFMVLGPMLDLKNLMLLLANFRKGFVLRFLLILLPIAFVVLITFTRFLFGWWS